MHRDLVYPGDSDMATLSDATLDVSGSFSIDGGDQVRFTIHVTSGSNGSFTTTVTETCTIAFANLNVTDATQLR